VTGAESGIGAACVARLRREGIDTVSFDLSAAADFQLDVSDGLAINAAVAEVGPVDILINSAGVIGPNKPLWEITDDEWQSTFSVNVDGVFNLCRAVVPAMREKAWGPDRKYRQYCRQRRQPKPGRLLGLEGCRYCPHQGPG
jgi:NAD(P)-dependent dehydrogenase (short-subunit alcohol dehydrogenase family)